MARSGFRSNHHNISYGSIIEHHSIQAEGATDHESSIRTHHTMDVEQGFPPATEEHAEDYFPLEENSALDGVTRSPKSSSEHPGLQQWHTSLLSHVSSSLRGFRWSSKSMRGDCVAALTVASLYVPMCFSFALLGQVGPLNSLYAFIFQPLVYAFLGSCPQLVVGPEATGSLVVGAAIHQLHSRVGGEDLAFNARIAGVATATAGAMMLAGGLGKIGFLDRVISRPLMLAFIGAVGLVLIVDQMIPELGLSRLAKESGVSHRSAAVKLGFLARHLADADALTATLSLASLSFVLLFRAAQKALRHRLSWISFLPDRLLVLLVTTAITWKLDLEKRGIEVVGDVSTFGSVAPVFHWPFRSLEHLEAVASSSFLMVLFGFFETSVTIKTLTSRGEAPSTSPVSANRDLVVLGVANLLGGSFTTLPAFGGFGRSKLNVETGGSTRMSNILLSGITCLCVFFVLPYLYFVPKPVLSSLATVVGISMMEELPHDIRFLIRVRGYQEIVLMALVFFGTVFFSMSTGVVTGIVFTLFRLVKHTSTSRIRLFRRVLGTKNTFEPLRDQPTGGECDDVLIVSISEPLTFANTPHLRTQLQRCHCLDHRCPGELCEESRHLVFDFKGLTHMDACAAHILHDIVGECVRSRTRVIFSGLGAERVFTMLKRSGIFEACGGERSFVPDLEGALQLID